MKQRNKFRRVKPFALSNAHSETGKQYWLKEP